MNILTIVANVPVEEDDFIIITTTDTDATIIIAKIIGIPIHVRIPITNVPLNVIITEPPIIKEIVAVAVVAEEVEDTTTDQTIVLIIETIETTVVINDRITIQIGEDINLNPIIPMVAVHEINGEMIEIK